MLHPMHHEATQKLNNLLSQLNQNDEKVASVIRKPVIVVTDKRITSVSLEWKSSRPENGNDCEKFMFVLQLAEIKDSDSEETKKNAPFKNVYEGVML